MYTDIYLLGIAAFTATYCIDTVSPAPTTAFISGLLVMSIAQSVNILVILTRGNGNFIGGAEARTMRAKRLLTVTSCIFASGSFIMFGVALGNSNVDASAVTSFFDLTFSVILPLIYHGFSLWFLQNSSHCVLSLNAHHSCLPYVSWSS